VFTILLGVVKIWVMFYVGVLKDLCTSREFLFSAFLFKNPDELNLQSQVIDIAVSGEASFVEIRDMISESSENPFRLSNVSSHTNTSPRRTSDGLSHSSTSHSRNLSNVSSNDNHSRNQSNASNTSLTLNDLANNDIQPTETMSRTTVPPHKDLYKVLQILSINRNLHAPSRSPSNYGMSQYSSRKTSPSNYSIDGQGNPSVHRFSYPAPKPSPSHYYQSKHNTTQYLTASEYSPEAPSLPEEEGGSSQTDDNEKEHDGTKSDEDSSKSSSRVPSSSFSPQEIWGGGLKPTSSPNKGHRPLSLTFYSNTPSTIEEEKSPSEEEESVEGVSFEHTKVIQTRHETTPLNQEDEDNKKQKKSVFNFPTPPSSSASSPSPIPPSRDSPNPPNHHNSIEMMNPNPYQFYPDESPPSTAITVSSFLQLTEKESSMMKESGFEKSYLFKAIRNFIDETSVSPEPWKQSSPPRSRPPSFNRQRGGGGGGRGYWRYSSRSSEGESNEEDEQQHDGKRPISNRSYLSIYDSPNQTKLDKSIHTDAWNFKSPHQQHKQLTQDPPSHHHQPQQLQGGELNSTFTPPDPNFNQAPYQLSLSPSNSPDASPYKNMRREKGGSMNSEGVYVSEEEDGSLCDNSTVYSMEEHNPDEMILTIHPPPNYHHQQDNQMLNTRGSLLSDPEMEGKRGQDGGGVDDYYHSPYLQSSDVSTNDSKIPTPVRTVILPLSESLLQSQIHSQFQAKGLPPSSIQTSDLENEEDEEEEEDVKKKFERPKIISPTHHNQQQSEHLPSNYQQDYLESRNKEIDQLGYHHHSQNHQNHHSNPQNEEEGGFSFENDPMMLFDDEPFVIPLLDSGGITKNIPLTAENIEKIQLEYCRVEEEDHHKKKIESERNSLKSDSTNEKKKIVVGVDGSHHYEIVNPLTNHQSSSKKKKKRKRKRREKEKDDAKGEEREEVGGIDLSKE